MKDGIRQADCNKLDCFLFNVLSIPTGAATKKDKEAIYGN